jgi:hypothetical protein
LGWTIRVRFPVVQQFSLHHSVQSSSRAHSAFHPMGTGGSSPGVKRQGCEVVYSSPSSAEVKNGGTIPPLPLLSSWHSAKPIQHVLQTLFDHLCRSITGGGNMDSLTCYAELTGYVDRFTSNKQPLRNSSCCLASMSIGLTS